jgi:hypothetical protein
VVRDLCEALSKKDVDVKLRLKGDRLHLKGYQL